MAFEAHRCPNGHLTYPGHYLCPECGERQTDTVDLSDRTGTVVTWTTSTATPPGVREPNTLAIVAFELEEGTVRALGQCTTDEIETGDEVEPVLVEQLRDPGAGIRAEESQEWDGYRFDPTH
ncbi:nucleic acid-binding protein [Halobacteriales archaeon QS_1_68_17]|nr:MAG: nucleic acid-binding protein [Halobacteriales archaeon QS_1_68_17]